MTKCLPPHLADNSALYSAKHSFNDTSTVQAKALSPSNLPNILESAILEKADIEQLEAALDWQQQIREAA